MLYAGRVKFFAEGSALNARCFAFRRRRPPNGVLMVAKNIEV